MNRPVKIPYDRIIQIDRNNNTAVYLQIAQQLINAIQRGYLLVGAKLPGSRSLAEILAVHRQTIVATYEELETQGWVDTKPNQGTYILDPLKSTIKEKPYKRLVSLEKYPHKTGYTISKSSLLDDPQIQSTFQFQLNDGQPDYRLSPLSQITSEYTAYLKRNIYRKISQQSAAGGTKYFREQLGNYLNLSRGLHISSENLLVTRSTEMCLYIVAKVLIQTGDIVVVGDLSYYTSNMIFQQAGAKLKTISVDDEGLNVDELEIYIQRHSIKAVYVNPHRHYPTTVSMSASRRVRLLQLSNQYQFTIIEDEYDFEFQYDRSAILPLASGDVDGMVVYLGSFGKSLISGFQTGFVVAPINLIIELRKYLSLLDAQGNYPLEQVLGMMIEEGSIDRYHRKLLRQYQQRRDFFCDLLSTHLGSYIHFKKPNGGLAVLVEFNNKLSLLKFAKLCAQKDLLIPKHLLYQNNKVTAIRMGFGSINDEEMESVMSVMRLNID